VKNSIDNKINYEKYNQLAKTVRIPKKKTTLEHEIVKFRKCNIKDVFTNTYITSGSATLKLRFHNFKVYCIASYTLKSCQI